ncbi:hypothetical protein OG920_44465 [Streptomyces europaeiscabiei]
MRTERDRVGPNIIAPSALEQRGSTAGARRVVALAADERGDA